MSILSLKAEKYLWVFKKVSLPGNTLCFCAWVTYMCSLWLISLCWVISTSGFQVFPRWLQCKTVHFMGLVSMVVTGFFVLWKSDHSTVPKYVFEIKLHYITLESIEIKHWCNSLNGFIHIATQQNFPQLSTVTSDWRGTQLMNIGNINYTIHMYSGITSDRALDGELLYTKILEVNLFAFAHRLFHEDFSSIDRTLPPINAIR